VHRCRRNGTDAEGTAPNSTLAELGWAARAKAGGAPAGSAKAPAEVKKWKAVLAGAKLVQVGVSLQGGRLTFSGIEPEMVKKVGAVLAKGGTRVACPYGRSVGLCDG
jgi:hypothetical protein